MVGHGDAERPLEVDLHLLHLVVREVRERPAAPGDDFCVIFWFGVAVLVQVVVVLPGVSVLLLWGHSQRFCVGHGACAAAVCPPFIWSGSGSGAIFLGRSVRLLARRAPMRTPRPPA
eukprot:1074069-Rhodomonas_salina.1